MREIAGLRGHERVALLLLPRTSATLSRDHRRDGNGSIRDGSAGGRTRGVVLGRRAAASGGREDPGRPHLGSREAPGGGRQGGGCPGPDQGAGQLDAPGGAGRHPAAHGLMVEIRSRGLRPWFTRATRTFACLLAGVILLSGCAAIETSSPPPGRAETPAPPAQ